MLFVLPFSRASWPLQNFDDVPIIADGDDNRVRLLTAGLIGWRRQVQLPAIPLAGHQRVIFDDRLFKLGHVLLAALYGSREHRFVLRGGIVLRNRGSGGTVEGASPAARRRV